jgi:hypothetical protein
MEKKTLFAKITGGLLGLLGLPEPETLAEARHNARPPACSRCEGTGRIAPAFMMCCFPLIGAVVCGHAGRLGVCPECGGAGTIPAKYAAIAVPSVRAGALAQYIAAAPWN